VHASPQAPQLLLLVLVLTQVDPQSVVPVGQAHVPFWQVLPLLHVLPQAPQFAGSLFVLTHTPEHTVCPLGHTHIPFVQLKPVPHATPQAPQSFGFVLRSTHWPLHGDLQMQVAFLHTKPAPFWLTHHWSVAGSSSTTPLQLSSRPLHVSGTGTTEPVHVPHPIGPHCCEPALHCPMPSVAEGPV
jgi:hypothetical protein